MGRSYFLCTTLMIALCVQPAASQGSQGFTSIVSDNVMGGNATITCSWVTGTNEKMLEVTITSLNNTQNGYYYQITDSGWINYGNNLTSTFSLDNVTVTMANKNVVMKITGLQCADEHEFYCHFRIGVQGSQPLPTSDIKRLIVKVPPSSPTMTVTPNTVDIREQTTVSVTCNANIGRPGKGDMVWKMYRGTEAVQIDRSRIVVTNVTLQPGDPPCSQRQDQTFKMNVSRTDQNLAFACFVTNDEFGYNISDVCSNTSAASLCRKSITFSINYGVTNSSMSITPDPLGNGYQGGTMTVTCQAYGYPAPSYTWSKVSADNSTSDTILSNTNELKLQNLNLDNSGVYRCTANNTVLGQEFYASQERTLSVFTTTTSTTRTTPIPTTQGTGTTAGQANNGNEPLKGGTDDPTNIIIIVVVVVGSLLIIAIVVGIVCWRRRSKKQIEEPSEKPYNNRTNLSFQNPQPDLVADKKFQNPGLDNANNKSSLNGSSPAFSEKKEDGLMYADLTYDNKPRSRKPMAINDSSSDYSDIQMPQV